MAMMSQSVNMLHRHHTRVGHRVVGRKGRTKVTKTNWRKAHAMTKQAAPQQRPHDPGCSCRSIWTKTILGWFQERPQVTKLLPQRNAIWPKPGLV